MKKMFFVIAFLLLGYVVSASVGKVEVIEDLNTDVKTSLIDFNVIRCLDALTTNFPSNEQYSGQADFTFVYVTSCGEVFYEDGYYNTVYYFSDLVLTWEIYDAIAC